jgi:DNA helicase-2/ATP-dependent DNA helicase PcrA
MKNILADLTESQKEAVTHGAGPLLVLAGPGSGKTRVITRRIAWLISSGVPPHRILAVTFTNKAAEEMRSRLRAMDVPPGSTLCTFHSLCTRLLREFPAEAGVVARFSIYDQADQKAVLREIYKEKSLDVQTYPPAAVLRRIGRDKSGLSRSGTRFREDFSAGLSATSATTRSSLTTESTGSSEALFKEIAESYERKLASAGALDFDDLLGRTAELLKSRDDIRAKLGRRYEYLMVDEYQDTNTCQYRIARDLAREHGNLFVTGDPDQSIYGWRGADIENILAFERDFPGSPVIRLEENFRSTPQVLHLADRLIRSNVRRKEKRLISRRAEGAAPRLYRYADEHEEALGAASWIRTMREDQEIEYKRIAVFYRTNAMSRVLEEALVRAHIPYQIVKGLEFLQRREIKDMLAYLRILANPADEISLLRIINRPARGIGETTVRKLLASARSSEKDFWSLLENPSEIKELSPASVSRLGKFVELVRGLQSCLEASVADIAREVYLRSGLKEVLREEKNEDAMENVEELIRSAEEFDAEFASAGGLALFLHQTALMSDVDGYDEAAGAVSLMTLHSAKGLEFAAVLIVGVEEGVIPHFRSTEEGRDLEEERRLLFVGITRAERILALSHARTRTMHGVSRPAALSTFLKDIDGLEVVPSPLLTGAFGTRPSVRDAGGPISVAAPPQADGVDGPSGAVLKTGDRVKHPSIGPGRIELIIPDGERSRVVIKFDSGARLTLVLKFARLELLDP